MAIQLQAFAERVLFGTTMEEKLSFPREPIIDTDRGSALKTPKHLSRPPHLTLRANGVKAKHPSQAKLIDSRERGRLLHFFGNHELLATELMALVLLKFPDAPDSFRRGVLETLKEEQIHTQMYIHRMEQCGVEFGELPLSDYFWRSVSSMEDPLDYVTRLSLTFEQANLDYSREYKRVFEQVGDTSTARILDKIYHDEIDHVGFGLRWFRQWKASGKTDWEAYRERLAFPLSPARAKGNDFNTVGRTDAGLGDDFIHHLEVFQQSKGRTPSVYWFNPEAERSAAHDSATNASAANRPLTDDLAFLPAYLSRKDDILLLARTPTSDFLQTLQGYGFQLPECLEHSPTAKSDLAEQLDRKINDFRPWAWAPDSVAYFAPAHSLLTKPPATDVLWNEHKRQLFSKVWSSNFGASLSYNNLAGWLAPPEVYGTAANSLEKLIDLRARLQAIGYSNIVCKAPFGTSANGNRCLMESEPIEGSIQTWIETILAEQGAIIVEPWLERVFDFSVQLEIGAQPTEPLAFIQIENNRRGQFKGAYSNAFCHSASAEVTRFLLQPGNQRPRVYELYSDAVCPQLYGALRESQFRGPLGIDAFVYTDPTGSLRLKPIVEINPRYTMGRIAHELGHQLAPRSRGFFEIITKSQLRRHSATSFTDYAKILKQTAPVHIEATAKGPRIQRGSLPLVEPNHAQHFLAVYHVSSA